MEFLIMTKSQIIRLKISYAYKDKMYKLVLWFGQHLFSEINQIEKLLWKQISTLVLLNFHKNYFNFSNFILKIRQERSHVFF